MSRTLSPCGTKSARNRHRRKGETCEACVPKPRKVLPCGTAASYKRGCRCEPCTAAARERQRSQARSKGIKPRVVAPCGSKSAKARHKARGEQCEACAPTGHKHHPCGTWQARRRHARSGESCDVCALILAPCGTSAARRRHARNNETCATCTVTRPEPAPATTKNKPLAPCGTTQARQRHKRRDETCTECGPINQPKQVKPCGTPAALKRHRYHNDPPCDVCLKADRERAEVVRRAKGIPEHITTEELIQELRFLLNAGEGTHRILTATGYKGREHSLRTRLGKAGHHQLAAQILNPWDLAA